jgi:hypothetical protein
MRSIAPTSLLKLHQEHAGPLAKYLVEHPRKPFARAPGCDTFYVRGMRRGPSFLSAVLLSILSAGCGAGTHPPHPPQGCALEGAVFEVGDPNGHADPTGARAAGQARAGRIQASAIAQPAHGRQKIEDGDFLLINDKIAVVIEDRGPSDGYARFGGEILAIDAVGEDGEPRGLSLYNETLMGFALQMIDPSSVSVLRDGSDGGEAVVRVTGRPKIVPFLDGPIKILFPRTYDLEMAYDYVLAPGAEKFVIRASVMNPGSEAVDFGVGSLDKDEYLGFFHYSRSQMVTAERGFAKPLPRTRWVGFDGGPWSFSWRTLDGDLEFGLEQSGFSLFWAAGFVVDACATRTVDRMEVVAGGPEYDGLREAMRRASGEPAWRAVTGTLSDGAGEPVPDAWIHGLDATGAYLTRTRTDASGAFALHAPPSAPITLVPHKRGYPAHPGAVVAPEAAIAPIAFDPHGALHVTAVDGAGGTPIPVRVQVIPLAPTSATPPEFGDDDEADGRLHQEFAVTGEATLPVPPGQHRVIVSRGYEWEILDTTVSVAAGATAEVPAALAHSVDTTGVMCADFHIHSAFSADSNDSVVHKVKGAIADGLDIPVSSEHEWVIDFQPVIEELGLSPWAFGVPSSELTTFAWGHFGVVPLTPRDGARNRGAVEWIGKAPPEVFGHVHSLPEDPVLIVNHPRGTGIGGFFSAANYDGVKDTGDPALWSHDFDAVEVFNDSDFEKNRGASVADWFALLNHGHRVIAVGSSDSHHLRTSPVGYPRTCMVFGHDDPKQLSALIVRDAIRSGMSTVSGGLTMTVTGPGGERPGETAVAPSGTATFLVTVEAPSWIAADSLEIIVNGATMGVEPLLPIGAGPSKRFANQVDVTFDPGAGQSWVVFHAKGETDLAPLHPGRRPFAVSNPVYLKGS